MRWTVVGRVALAIGLSAAPAAFARDAERGWSYLVEKLVGDGVPRERALRVFRDERVDPFGGLQFSLEPRESPALYRGLRTRTTAFRARTCIDEHRAAFELAERRYGVPTPLVASIIQVESGCGRNTGRARIVPALARLAMAAEPGNLEDNVARLTLFETRPAAEVASFASWRARYLEDLFYPELRAALDVADRLGLDPLEMRGSGSGAFGIPQFLPRSYLWFGADGNDDGRVSLYDPEDAIASCARYLERYGWRPGLARREQRNVIWGYNRSDAYIDTVLWLADEVESPTPAKPVARVAKRRAAPKKRAKAPVRRKTASAVKTSVSARSR